MLQRFTQFEAKKTEWSMLKDLPFWKNLSVEHLKTLSDSNIKDTLLVKKVSKKFAKDFMGLKNPKPFKAFYIIKDRLIGTNNEQNVRSANGYEYGYMEKIGLEIDGIPFDKYMGKNVKSNLTFIDKIYYDTAINLSTDIYMSYSEEDAPKALPKVKNVNVDQTLKSIWDINFKEMLETFANKIINTLNEEGVEVIKYVTAHESEYGPYIAFYLENNDNFFIYHKSYHINFIGKNKPPKSGKTDKLDLKNLAQLLKK